MSQRDPHASDANAGTASRPWRSIQRAAETLRAGDTVLIHDGLYREFVRPFLGGEPGRPITYRAAPGQRPVLTGADTWTPPWTDEGNSEWSAPYRRHPWDDPEHWPTPQHGAVHRAEQIIVDSRVLRQVDTRDELSRRADAFWTDDGTHRLWLHLAAGPPPSRRRVERAMRPQVFAPAVRGLGYLRVIGLTMRYAAGREWGGTMGFLGQEAMLSARSGNHWLIEDCDIAWGNSQGIEIGREGWAAAIGRDPSVGTEPGFHVLRHNRVSHQGIAGIVAFSASHLLLEDNETDFNGEKGDFAGYESAGVKFHDAQDCLIRRHTAVGNQSFGIWFDLHARHDRVTQCVLKGNRGAGLMYELSGGPFLADDNVIVGTEAAPGDPGWADGIYSHDGSGAVYLHNYIADCIGFGVRLQNTFGRKDLDGQPTTTSHNRVWNNYLWDNAGGAVSFNPDVPLAEDNRSDANLLWQRGGPVTCRLDESGFDAAGLHWDQTATGKALGANDSAPLTLPLVRWQQAAGQDHDSLALPRSTAFPSPDLGPVRARLTRLQTVLFPALSGNALDPPPAPVSAAQMETAIGQVSASGTEISKEKEQQR